MKDQHSISFLLLNHLHTSTLLIIDNFISQLPCNLEDLQYVRNIKVNVRGVLVAHVVALTLCAAAAVRSAPLSPPHCFQQHWRHRRLAALSPLSTCLEDLQYVRNIKVNVRGVLVAHVVALTLCAAAAVRSAPLSPPHFAFNSIGGTGGWRRYHLSTCRVGGPTRRLQRHTFIPLCAPTAPVDSSSLAAPAPSMLRVHSSQQCSSS